MSLEENFCEACNVADFIDSQEARERAKIRALRYHFEPPDPLPTHTCVPGFKSSYRIRVLCRSSSSPAEFRELFSCVQTISRRNGFASEVWQALVRSAQILPASEVREHGARLFANWPCCWEEAVCDKILTNGLLCERHQDAMNKLAKEIKVCLVYLPTTLISVVLQILGYSSLLGATNN